MDSPVSLTNFVTNSTVPQVGADNQPRYNRSSVQPGIVNFGTGRRFRVAVAPLVDRVLALGHWDCGIIAVSQSGGAVHRALLASGGLYQISERDGAHEAHHVIGSVLKVLDARHDHAAVIASIADPRISIITVTVSEAALGASPDGQPDRSNADIMRELAGASDPVTPVGQIVAGLAARRDAGWGGLTIMACDNVVGNHLRLASLVDAMAVAQDVQLADWIAMNCRFPGVFGDRLLVREKAAAGDVAAVATEPFAHWVIEDNLGSERGALEDAGVALVRDVAPFLTMRQRLLDGGLLLLGCVGLLRGYVTLDQAYADPELAALFDGYIAEAALALPPIKGLDSERYVAQLKPRLANPSMCLPLAVCAQGGSLRLPISALATIVESMRVGRRADYAAALVAAWMVHCTSPDLVDPHAEALWTIANANGDNWPQLVDGFSGFAPVFGSVGQKPVFRDMITRAAGLLPGLSSLVND